MVQLSMKLKKLMKCVFCYINFVLRGSEDLSTGVDKSHVLIVKSIHYSMSGNSDPML